MSTLRPLAILATPNTDKKNKQVACAKSLTSTANGYLIALACSLPLSRAIKTIDRNPKKYLNPNTIKNLTEEGKKLTDSKAYAMATQLFKLGLGLLIAAPKAVLTALGTPYVLKIFEIEKKKDLKSDAKPNSVSFKASSKLPKKIGSIINNKSLQNFVKKHKESNFPLHIVAATDTIATATFVQQTATSNKFEQKDKKPLIYNSIIATTLSIASTYLLEGLTKKHTDNFIKNLTKSNKNDPDLLKYIEGVKIAKPILIAGAIYYIMIPVISTFLADRVNHKKN